MGPIVKAYPTAFVISLALGICGGCQRGAADVDMSEWEREDAGADFERAPKLEWSQENITDRDIEIIMFLLKGRSSAGCFLTLTPMFQWGETGEWQDIPEPLRDALIKDSIEYRPANAAYLEKGRVMEKTSKSSGRMRWVTIRRWISETEVEIEEGVWTAPLGGGGSIAVYKKVKGTWRRTKSSRWVS